MKDKNVALKGLRLAKAFRLMNVERKMIYLFTIILFIAANIFMSLFSLRADFSNGHAYTLSPATDKVLRNLDDIVNIKLYVSSDIPTRLAPLKTDVTDLINEYKKSGGRNIRVQILDPKKDSAALQQAKEAGIPELQFSQQEQDHYAVTAAYFGILLTHADKKEVLPQATDMGSLEYNLTAAIYKMTNKHLAKIGIIGYPETTNPQQDPIGGLRRVLQKQFDVHTIETASTAPSMDDRAVLLFDNTQAHFDDKEVAALEKYLEHKGTIIAFADGVWVRDTLATETANHNLFNLFRKYGIVLNKDLVMSSASELVNFGNENVSFFVPYPYWIKTNDLAKSSYFANIHQLTFPWVSSLTPQSGKSVSTLVKTVKSSWVQTSNFTLNPQELTPPAAKDLKQSMIVAQSRVKNGGTLIVIPSSRFVLDKYLSTNAGNLEFVLNTVNELASGGALSGIRQREVTFYPLPDIPESQKDVFKYTTMLLLPLLAAGYGAYRIMKRK